MAHHFAEIHPVFDRHEASLDEVEVLIFGS